MTQLAFINGATLKVVREDRGVSREFLSKKTQIALSSILLWENGSTEDYPTMRQAEAISRVLQTPLASLYLGPQNYPKSSIPGTVNMRRMIDAVTWDDSSINLAIVQLCGLRQRLREFRSELGEPELSVALPTLNADPKAAATELRNVLGVEFGVQKTLHSSRKLFKLIRSRLEERGVLLAEFTGVDTVECRGLSLFFDEYAIAGVNANDRWPGQCFSAIHELGHLSMRASAVCNDMELDALRWEEVYCNALAGNFLVPASDLERCLGQSNPESAEVIEELRWLFSVSKEVITRRLLDLGYLDMATYERIINELKQQLEEEKARTKAEADGRSTYRPDPARVSVDMRGVAYVSAVQGCLSHGLISELDAAAYLGVSHNKLDRVFREALQ